MSQRDSMHRVHPLILKKLEHLVANPEHGDYTAQTGKAVTGQQFLKLDALLSSRVVQHETFAPCFAFHISQSRALDWNTSSANFTPGSLQFGTFQVILHNDSFVPKLEMALYQNTAIKAGEYRRIIDANDENIVKNKRLFEDATVRGVHIFDEYIILEFQSYWTSNESTDFSNSNAKGGQNVSQYDLAAGKNKA